jgi:hypothetical protein
MYFLLLDIANFGDDKFIFFNFSKKLITTVALKINFEKASSSFQTNSFYSSMHADHTSR